MSLIPYRRSPGRSRLAQALLRPVLGEDTGPVLEDLREAGWARRQAGAGGFSTRLWWVWQVVTVFFYALRDRMTGQVPPSPTHRPRGGPHVSTALLLAWRGLRRDPRTTLAAALTLALGLGAGTAMYSVLEGFTRPLPVPEGDRYVRVTEVDAAGRRSQEVPADLLPLVGGADDLFEAAGAFRTFGAVVAGQGRYPQSLPAAALSDGLLRALRVAPQAGRLWDEDAAIEAGPTVILDDVLAREWFGREGPAIGRPVEVNGVSHRVIGVMPPGFGFPYSERIWVRMAADGSYAAGGAAGPVEITARLRSGVDASAASVRLTPLLAAVALDAGAGDIRIVALPFTTGLAEGGEVRIFRVLLLLIIFLLLLACANVVNLLLARSTQRMQMLRLQQALGAGRGQVVLQLLFESTLIACAGGLLGLLVAGAAVAYFSSTLGSHFGFHWMAVRLDGGSVGFVGLLVVGSGLVAGVLPALWSSRPAFTGMLRAGDGVTGGRAFGRLSRWSVSFQLALSLTLLIPAFLMTLGLRQMQSWGGSVPGDQVLVARITLMDAKYAGTDQRAAYLERLQQALKTGSTGEITSLYGGVPGGPGSAYAGVEVPGAGDGVVIPAMVSAADAGFFQVFGMQLLQGRLASPGAPGDQVGEAVVDRALAGRLQEDGDVLGRRIGLRQPTGAGEPRQVVVVGVVDSFPTPLQLGDVRYGQVFLPIQDGIPISFMVAARSTSGTTPRLEGLQQAALVADPMVPLQDPMTWAGYSAFMRRFYDTMGALGLAGGVGALLIALAGLYGLLAFQVRRQTREMGIRMALGADPRVLLRHVLLRGLRYLAPGLLVGLVLTWLMAPLFGPLLLGQGAHALLPFLAVSLIMLAGGLAAAAGPALRAAATHPADVLREETA